MAKPKPKPLGTVLDVPEGALVRRPGASDADVRTVVGGSYVLDVPGVHVVDGREIEVTDEREPAEDTPAS